MKQYSTNSFKIYKGQGKNFVFVDDLFMFELIGKDSKIVLDLIEYLKSETRGQEEIFDHFKRKYSKDKLKKGLMFLKDMFLLKEEEQVAEVVNYSVVGNFENPLLTDILTAEEENQSKVVFKHSKTYSYEDFDLEELKKQDLVIFDGDLIENSEALIQINAELYNDNVTLAYFSLDRQQVIEVGPICKKQNQSPCLESFMKRKVSNLQNPELFLNVLKLDQETTRVPISTVTQKIGINLLKRELTNYFADNFSNLLGANFQLDIYTLEMSKSIILKAYNLSYEETPIITPFN